MLPWFAIFGYTGAAAKRPPVMTPWQRYERGLVMLLMHAQMGLAVDVARHFLGLEIWTPSGSASPE